MRRVTLDNGLRVLLGPRTVTPVVDIAVHYHVGFRSDPLERAGLAHLLEHLMFAGSAHVAPGGHHRTVQAAGGHANAATHPDHTEYVQSIPPRALERVLFLEADRMRGPRLTEQSLRTEIGVIKEEVRLNVTNKPYGGFPWTVLPQVLYRRFANAHDGYGTYETLKPVEPAEVADFFATHYAPSNAVLTLSGCFEPDVALELVKRHFGDIPPQPPVPRAELSDPEPEADRYGRHRDPFAPRPALAVGHRLPDPLTEPTGYLAHTLLAHILAARLSNAYRPGTAVHARSGLFGPFLAHAPDTWLLTATHHPEVAADAVLATVDAELAAVADGTVEDYELVTHAARAATETHRSHDVPLGRVRRAGAFEVLHGVCTLVDEIPILLGDVTVAALCDAAQALRRPGRAVLLLDHGRGAGSKAESRR